MRKSIPTPTTLTATTTERLLEEETEQGSDEESSRREGCWNTVLGCICSLLFSHPHRCHRSTGPTSTTAQRRPKSSRTRRPISVDFSDASSFEIRLSETDESCSRHRLNNVDTDDFNNNEWDSATTNEFSIHALYEMLQSDRIAYTTRKKTLDDGVLLSSDDFFFHGSWTSTSSSTLHDDDDENVDRTSDTTASSSADGGGGEYSSSRSPRHIHVRANSLRMSLPIDQVFAPPSGSISTRIKAETIWKVVPLVRSHLCQTCLKDSRDIVSYTSHSCDFSDPELSKHKYAGHKSNSPKQDKGSTGTNE